MFSGRRLRISFQDPSVAPTKFFSHFGGPRKRVKKQRFAFLEDYSHARTSSGGSGSHRSLEIHQSSLVVLEESEQSRFSLFAHAENGCETAQRFNVRCSPSCLFRTFVCFPHLLGLFDVKWSLPPRFRVSAFFLFSGA